MQQVYDAQQSKAPGILDTSQIDLLANVLSRSFHDNPNFVYMIPDEGTRRTLSPWFFRSAIRATQLYGEIYTTETIDGGALWFRSEESRAGNEIRFPYARGHRGNENAICRQGAVRA